MKKHMRMLALLLSVCACLTMTSGEALAAQVSGGQAGISDLPGSGSTGGEYEDWDDEDPGEDETGDYEEYEYDRDILQQSEETVVLAKGGALTLSVLDAYAADQKTWESSGPDIVSVDAAGTVTAKAVGTATVTVHVVTAEGMKYKDSVTVAVTDPQIASQELNLNLYNAYKGDGYYYCDDNIISVTGLYDADPYDYWDSGSTVTAVSDSSNLKVEVSSYQSDGQSEVYVYPKKAGTYKVTVTADGRTFEVTVNVRNIYFSRNSKSFADGMGKKWIQGASMVALAKGESTTLTLNGAEGLKVSYTSSDKSVAAVNNSGKVKAKGFGYATITASAAGMELTYEVGVSSSKAIRAMRYAAEHFGSTYSQPKRMQKGYYDCSSYVWRSYQSAKTYVGSKSYAPTASEMARWCVKNGYMIFKGSADMSRMLPGDLIFWTGENNGRYEGIYHVDLYVGNGASITVEREKSFWSGSGNFMVARPCGVSASGLKVSAADGGGLKLSWSETFGAAGYQVYRSTSKNSGFKKIAKVKNATSYVDTKCTSGRTWYYKVRPYWKSKKTYAGKFSSVVSGKAGTAGMTAPKLSLKKNAGGKVTLKWGKVSGAKGYVVYRSTGKNGSYKKIATIKKGTAVTCTDRKAKKGKTFYYKIRSYRRSGAKTVYSGYSGALKVTVR